jgi:hypothetical protein
VHEAACDDCLSGSTLMGSKLEMEVCRLCSRPSALEIIYMQGCYSRAKGRGLMTVNLVSPDLWNNLVFADQ